MVTLQVEDISYSYGSDFSLYDIRFSILGGNVCVLLGPNASGKTTLIKYLSGIFGYKKGELIVDGKDVSYFDPKTAAKTLSYVPQIHEASFPYSVLDMVVMGRNPHMDYFSLPSEDDYDKSREALTSLGIGALADTPYTELSGGQQKLALIARALAQEAPVMLLDEPTAHLDYRNRLLILRKIRELVKRKNIVALLSLHDPNEAIMVADEMLIMTGGTITQKGSLDTVLTKDCIRDLYNITVDIMPTRMGHAVVVPSLDSMED